MGLWEYNRINKGYMLLFYFESLGVNKGSPSVFYCNVFMMFFCLKKVRFIIGLLVFNKGSPSVFYCNVFMMLFCLKKVRFIVGLLVFKLFSSKVVWKPYIPLRCYHIKVTIYIEGEFQIE